MKTGIIPINQTFCKKGADNRLNLKAICIFSAIGFFMEKDTYFNNSEVLQPATEYKIGENNCIIKSRQYWKWHYSPRDISLKQATEEFADIFEKISNENLKDKKVILPLSGGLDSRTQAAALKKELEVKSYSYKFEYSFDETKYGKQIADIKSYPFKEYIIPKGYLWNVIDDLSILNQCYSDLTSPRQMAVIEDISKLGNVFYLGHWGDVLFDDMDISEDINFDEQVEILKKKILKKGGAEIGEALWKNWGLEGNFINYFTDRISVLLQNIEIENVNSRIRAFKSLYWAPRWTSVNLVVFSKYHPVSLPYYDDEMCRFICTISENLLSGRQIQINYIKMKNPELAKIPWQNYDPLNLYDYKNYESLNLLPLRIFRKARKLINEKVLGKRLTTRNWEIQFLGNGNDFNLKKHLFENKKFAELISPELVKIFYDKFINVDSVKYSHPVNMLLTISQFCKNNL